MGSDTAADDVKCTSEPLQWCYEHDGFMQKVAQVYTKLSGNVYSFMLQQINWSTTV
jgi:hypothetical protein